MTLGDHGISVKDLGGWMDDHGLAGTGEEPELERLTGGSQNDLLVVTRAAFRCVLRIPPRAADARRQDGLRREITLLTALRHTDVPHARIVAACTDIEPLGRPFYLMEEVEGWSPQAQKPWPANTSRFDRAALAFGLVEGAASLANVEWQKSGLEGFGRPDGFHERQVDRWAGYLKDYQFRELPGFDEATAWLGNNRPTGWEPGVMHGDYQFVNVMFSNEDPPRLAAIIDWEMATIGDPLLDLAWALIAWSPEGDDMTHARFIDLDHMPGREDLLAHYESLTGRTTQDFDYYLILARWKLAIVLERSYARYFVGETTDTAVAWFGDLVLELMRKAASLARSTSKGK